jgi:saccharopine dehydrogenase-like NADP-dependent oxidoreductase
VNLAFWAENEQFSFAHPKEYIEFEIPFTAVKISEQGLTFRQHHSELWAILRGLGLAEEDLLVKGLGCISTKRKASP